MAVITINEISKNYNFAVGTSTYATVALPITSSWGPGYFDPATIVNDCKDIDPERDWDAENHSDMLDRTAWNRFPASQAGLESFVATYRSPIANYRQCNDYSYQMALTLLSSGYDVLVCRLSPGAIADGTFIVAGDTPQSGQYKRYVSVKAKYPGTFGNNLRIEFKNVAYMYNDSVGSKWAYSWNMIVYIVDNSGIKNAVENLTFVFDIDNVTQTVPHWREVESEYVTLNVVGNIPDFIEVDGKTERVFLKDINNTDNSWAVLQNGTDMGPIPTTPNNWASLSGSAKITAQKKNLLTDAKKWADIRFRYNGTADENLNMGFEYAGVERNYVLAFDYMLGDSATVVESIASLLNVPSGSAKYQVIEDHVGTFDLDTVDLAKAEAIRFREWVFTHLVGIKGREDKFDRDGNIRKTNYEGVYDLLKDRLAYNPNRVISPGWDDQDFLYLFSEDSTLALCPEAWGIRATSPIHRKLMDTAYHSRCATGMLDIPRSLDRKYVYNEADEDFLDWGYAQKLARYIPDNTYFTADVQLYHTHSALFTCWGRYQYQGLTRQTIAPPAFLAIMIQRAMVLNQAVQYEWILPTDRKQNLKIGKLDYIIPQKLLNQWQTTEGVGVNCITTVPSLGTTLWGNSTLFEVPPATYQALANLSTRYLVNAIEDVVYRVGISITFQYSNSEAFASFTAGCIPILDTMKNAGALESYYIKMNMDINEAGVVAANSVVGKIYIVANGVINNITVDLIALPPGTDLTQYQ